MTVNIGRRRLGFPELAVQTESTQAPEGNLVALYKEVSALVVVDFFSVVPLQTAVITFCLYAT